MSTLGADARGEARRLAGLVLLRALISSALFGAALLTGSATGDQSPSQSSLFAYLSAAYGSAALEFVWVLGGRRLRQLGYIHAGVEAGLAAWLVALTGGPESPFVFLLLLATVLGALAAGSLGAFVSATLASGALVAFAIGSPLATLIQPAHAPDSRTLAVVLASGGGCFATAALASYLTERLRRTGRELTERETQLRELGALYLTVAQSLRSGLMTLGIADRPGDASITLMNDPGAAILGIRKLIAPTEIVAPADAVGPLTRPSKLCDVAPEFAQALDAASTHGRSEVALKRNGRTTLIGFSVSPLRGERGEALGSVVTFQDLTDQRRLEEAMRRQSHLASLGELAAGLAHEVRNPLASLSGAAQMLRSSSPSESGGTPRYDDRKLFDLIQRETAHLETLVSDFLIFARPPAPVLTSGDLGGLASATFEAFRTGEQLGSRELSIDVASVQADFDAGQLRQVLWNLLRNALEATEPTGHIALRVRALEGGGGRIEVEDDGPGIPAELREHIFEPFFTTKEKGTGLGLALVARIVGAHGGTIDVEPMEQGARFVLALPPPQSLAVKLVS